jgi:hypothetical protein
MIRKRQCTPKLRKSVATGEDTRAARSTGKTAGSSGERIEIDSWKPRPPVAMGKAERDPGAHPKIKTAKTLLRAAAAWMAKQSSDPNTRKDEILPRPIKTQFD